MDERTGRSYFYNATTKMTKWEKPQNSDIVALAKLQVRREGRTAPAACGDAPPPRPRPALIFFCFGLRGQEAQKRMEQHQAESSAASTPSASPAATPSRQQQPAATQQQPTAQQSPPPATPLAASTEVNDAPAAPGPAPTLTTPGAVVFGEAGGEEGGLWPFAFPCPCPRPCLLLSINETSPWKPLAFPVCLVSPWPPPASPLQSRPTTVMSQRAAPT